LQFLNIINSSTGSIFYSLFPAGDKNSVSSGDGSFTADSKLISSGATASAIKIADPSLAHIVYLWKGKVSTAGGYLPPDNGSSADYGVYLKSDGTVGSSFNSGLNGAVSSMTNGSVSITATDLAAPAPNKKPDDGLSGWWWFFIILGIIVVIIIIIVMVRHNKNKPEEISQETKNYRADGTVEHNKTELKN